MQLPPTLETTPPSPGERRGSALAHGSGVVIGLPLIFIGLNFGIQSPFAYIPSAIIAYLIARSFRRRRLAWGSFQGMQATVIHLIITFLLFTILFLPDDSRLFLILPALVVLLLIYTLWGAWDNLFGEDFRYILISRLLYKVSETNLQRQERRRGLFRPYRIENDDQPRE